jgi:hypothetical protein
MSLQKVCSNATKNQLIWYVFAKSSGDFENLFLNWLSKGFINLKSGNNAFYSKKIWLSNIL